ncbi:MAG TPA: hypothetical protein VFK04_13020 [Gemmatimonadaceae bacterium]|nr:hypothetical protein [Gemmatimonadaceae bacterium]
MATVALPGVAATGDILAPRVEPSRRARIIAALAIGLASALFTAFVFARPGAAPDFAVWYHGARLMLSGANPYHLPLSSAAWPFDEPLYYPLPAAILTIPLAWLSLPLAGALFMGISGGLLAWLVSRDGLWRLWLFGTASYFMACKVGQWSPLIAVGALLPAAGFLAAMKPNLGLAALAYRPSWRAMLGCAAVGLVSFAVLPSWLTDWHANTTALVGHSPPILTFGGPILLLALLRWRRPEARLLLVMACVPQLLFWADQLPLFLIPRTRREMNAFFLINSAACFVWYVRWASNPAYVLAAEPYVFWGTYIPCLVLVLRRPNEGELPDWIERLLRAMRSRAARVVRVRGV